MSTSGEDVRQEQINKLALEIEMISKSLNENLELIKNKVKAINEAVAKSTVDEKIISEYKELNKKIQKQKEEINNRIDKLKDQSGDIGFSSQELFQLAASQVQLGKWKEFPKLSRDGKTDLVILPKPEFTEEAKKLFAPNLTPPTPPVPITPPQTQKKEEPKKEEPKKEEPKKDSTWKKGTAKGQLGNTRTNDWVFNKKIEKQIIENTKQAIDSTFKDTDKKSAIKYENSKEGHLNVSTPKKEIDFQANPNSVSSQNVGDENLKAMAIAYRANLETRIKAGQLGLKVSIGECSPAGVKEKFSAYINNEIEKMMLANKDDPNFKKYDLDKLKIPTELSSPKAGVKIEQEPLPSPKTNGTPSKTLGM